MFFREALYYLRHVQASATMLTLQLLALPWFMACFHWLWCDPTPSLPQRCRQPVYAKATSIVWRVLLCMVVCQVREPSLMGPQTGRWARGSRLHAQLPPRIGRTAAQPRAWCAAIRTEPTAALPSAAVT